MEKNLKHILLSDTSHWKADRMVRQRYADIRSFDSIPLWFSRLGVSWMADSLLACLQREVPRNGLDTTAFFLEQITQDLEIVHTLAFDSLGISINEVLPRLDYCLSKAYIRYTVGQRYGFMRPDVVFNHLDKKANTEDFARLFDHEVAAPDYKEALRLLDDESRMDYLKTSQPANPIYQTFQRQLASTTDKATRRKLAINMERCRWQIKQQEAAERTVLVNIPAQQLWAVGPDSVLSMRICCGAKASKTPLLNSVISYMQVNPDWIIPQNIVASDIVRHAGDSAYFARHHYYIVDRNSGDTLQPAHVGSSQILSGHLRIGQKGGEGNSLGRIVFRFPNNFAVYLHDTNNRNAFSRERRTLSHGCIRVEKPFELACFLLPEADDWEKDKLRISMDIEPETEKGVIYLEEHADEQRPYRLLTYHAVTPKVPVYILYFTVYPNPETGETEMWPDVYGYDEVIAREIKPFLP